MLSDLEIAQAATIQNITEIASKLGLLDGELDCYGRYKAKVLPSVWERISSRKNGKLILVTAINPTPAGEGKTTTSIGLGDALQLLGKNVCIALREPSLGPCFGLKGCATGGGYSQVVPMEDINLHFNGDIHAITAVHNLLTAIIDNHVYNGNKLNIDVNRIEWNRVLDVNDRSLRKITIAENPARATSFDITAASEIMAIVCLSDGIDDLRKRIDKIIIGYDKSGMEVTCGMLNATGALLVLLKDAIKPNLVQTLEGTPVFIHGGPFANIAHGCNSLIATKYALKLSDFVITEAGFGADLGAEKFLDIKCPLLGKYPDVIVIVATIRALKMHGGATIDQLKNEDLTALDAGFSNLEKHIQNMQRYGIPVAVTLNVFQTDTENELNLVKNKCLQLGIEMRISDVWKSGGQGGTDLAELVVDLADQSGDVTKLYDVQDSVVSKVNTIAKEIYGANEVAYTDKAMFKLRSLDKFPYPVCIAKTPNSLSDNKALLGAPKEFKITIKDFKLMNGAGFIVAYAGDIVTMPGLPKSPRAESIDLLSNGKIVGLE